MGPAPEWIAAGTPQPLRSDLKSLLGADRVLTRALDLIRYASDASPYRLFPKAVVQARNAGDVANVLRYGREHGVPVTLRSAGTSLNGQGQSDGILVDVRRHFTGVEVEEVAPRRVLAREPRSDVRTGCCSLSASASAPIRRARTSRPLGASSRTTPAGCGAA